MSVFLPIFSALLSIGLIFYSYKNRKSATSKILPSLFFLKQLAPKAPKSRKRKLPFRFFLELLFISIISSILLLANDLSNQKKYRLILDVSQSMEAETNGSSRFKLAKADLLHFISTQDSSTQYYFETTPSNKQTNDLLNRSELEQIINETQTIPLPDEFSSLGELETTFDESIVFTDKKISGSSLTQKRNYHSPESNLALISVKTPSRKDLKYLNVHYFFSGSGSNSFDLSIKELSSNKTIHKEKVEVLSPGRGNVSIQLNDNLSKNSYYQINISDSLQIDSIKTDNKIFLSPTEEESQDILLISPNNTGSYNLNSIKALVSGPAKLISEEEYQALSKDIKEASPLQVFYKTPMPKDILAPTLIILPSTNSSLLDIKGIIPSPQISSWNESSQITRYISFENLKLLSAISFKEAFWGNPIIRVNGSVSLIEGQINGFPVIASGIELLPFEGKDSPSASILMLNILKKLDGTNKQDTAEPLSLNAGDTAIELLSKKPYTLSQSLPSGIYEINRSSEQNKNQKHIEISNDFNLEESDTRTLNEEIVTIKKGISKPKIFETDLLFNLSILALAILGLDLLLILILGREI